MEHHESEDLHLGNSILRLLLHIRLSAATRKMRKSRNTGRWTGVVFFVGWWPTLSSLPAQCRIMMYYFVRGQGRSGVLFLASKTRIVTSKKTPDLTTEVERLGWRRNRYGETPIFANNLLFPNFLCKRRGNYWVDESDDKGLVLISFTKKV